METNTQNIPLAQMNNSVASSDTNAPESYFESLGLVIDNGKPRFKIGEPTFLGTAAATGLNLIDKDESMSFVILGKDSVDSIQAMSQASYNDIQQKSISIDCNSMVSSLSTEEIQTKLSSLLQENVKLKETLKQNNIAMKQQFNTIVSWQEEMIKARQKIRESNKQKFAETRNLISHLKKENSELKLKLAAENHADINKEYEIISYITQDENAAASFKTLSSGGNQDEEIKTSVQNLDKETREKKSVGTPINISFINEDDEKTECQTSVYQINQKEGTEISVQTSLQSHNLKTMAETSVQTCDEMQQSQEGNDLKKMAASASNAVLQQSNKEQFNEIVIQHPSKADNPPFYEGRQLFIQTVKKYNEKMHNLMDCFSAQSARFANIEEYLKESSKILDVFKFTCLARKHPETGEFQFIVSDEIRDYRNSLYNYQRKLLGEQLNIISDRQNLIRAVNEFQSLFSDYNTILCEMEVISEENKKLVAVNSNMYRDSMDNATELEKFRDKENKRIEEEIHLVEILKSELIQEKMQVECLKKDIENELKCVQNERQLLEEEKVALKSERASLDQQSKLYDSVLQTEKKSLEKRCAELLDKSRALSEQVEHNDMMITELQKDTVQKEQKIELLETQLRLYKEDFEMEKRMKKEAVEEKARLNEALQQQCQYNSQLQQQLNASQNGSNTSTVVPSPYPCPVCLQCFSTGLEEHVERCLNSN